MHHAFILQFLARGLTQVLLCLFPGVLWLWHFLYSVGPHPVSSLHIYTFAVSQAFMAGAASQAGDADSSRAPGLTSDLQGSVNVHLGALLLVLQWQCISSFVFYIQMYKKVTTDLSIDQALHQLDTEIDLVSEWYFTQLQKGFCRTLSTFVSCQEKMLTSPDIHVQCIILSRWGLDMFKCWEQSLWYSLSEIACTLANLTLTLTLLLNAGFHRPPATDVACRQGYTFGWFVAFESIKISVFKIHWNCNIVGLLHHPFWLYLVLAIFGTTSHILNYFVWLRITDEGSVPEMRIWSISNLIRFEMVYTS